MTVMVYIIIIIVIIAIMHSFFNYVTAYKVKIPQRVDQIFGRGMAGMGGEVASFPTDARALVPRVGITGVLKLIATRSALFGHWTHFEH